jgi:hypothetical protein
MSIQLFRSLTSNETRVQFTITDHVDDGVISVVGSFNDWTPGITVFHLRPDGTRVAEITVDSDEDIHFRYLGSTWFDDPEADAVTEGGSVIRLNDHDGWWPEGA